MSVLSVKWNISPEISVTSSKPVPLLPGDSVTLTCSMNGSQILNYTVSWLLNGIALVGETSAELEIPQVDLQLTGIYECIVNMDCAWISGSLLVQIGKWVKIDEILLVL